MDGPGELNDVRWHGDLQRTRRSTAQSQSAIERLCRESIPCSLIITLHRGNATAERLPALTAWLRDLHRQGVRRVRLHLLESENTAIRAAHSLSEVENVAVLEAFLALERDLPALQFDLFPEMRLLLMGDDHRATCIWNGCDPYTTHAVRGVEGQGQRSNCGRTNKLGIDFVKAAVPGFERYVALYQTPQSAGGCNGCRFFLMCKGQCPGTAIDGDWRNRTEHCGVWKAMFQRFERELVAEQKLPLSLMEERTELELRAIDRWSKGQYVRMYALLQAESAVSPQQS